MQRIEADAYKIATTARKPSDNIRVLAAAKGLPKQRMIVLAMGELGFPTRVLSPVFGGTFTYAAPMQAEGTSARLLFSPPSATGASETGSRRACLSCFLTCPLLCIPPAGAV